MANPIPPTLHSAQDQLHHQMDSAVDRFHKQNDGSQHLQEDQDKALGFKRPSGQRKAIEQQNHFTEERLKSGFHGLDEQTKREGRLPTAAEMQAVIGGTGAAPYINQLTPDKRPPGYQGQEYCGPTVMAMIARQSGLAEGLTDGQLVQKFAQLGGTNEIGTTGNGMITIGQQMGLQANASKGADFNFIDAELAKGRPVVAMGDFYALAAHADPTKDSGHYIMVQSRDAYGNYRVSDPQTDRVTTLTQDALRTFMTSMPTGGFALSFG